MNAKLDYALLRRTEHPDEGILIIGKDRLEALNKVLGDYEVLGILSGGKSSFVLGFVQEADTMVAV